MDFSLSEEQQQFQSMLQRFMKDHYSVELRRNALSATQGYNVENWRTLGELGVLALPFHEDVGGLGGSQTDLMIVMEAFGVGPLVEPFLSSILMAGQMIERGGDSVQKSMLLPGLINGHQTIALAYLEDQSRSNLANHQTRAVSIPNGYRISGSKTCVLGNSMCSHLIVVARTSGEMTSPNGLSAFIVATKSQGITLREYRLVDGSPAMRVDFENVTIADNNLIGQEDEAYNLLEDTIAFAGLGLSAEAVGIMASLFAQTLDYLKIRKQFGRPLGSFQALQHRMADHLVNLEIAKSILVRAVATSREDRSNWLKELIGARALISDISMKIGQDAIQLHGAMGVTDELIISHYHKRLLFIQSIFGDANSNYRRQADLAA